MTFTEQEYSDIIAALYQHLHHLGEEIVHCESLSARSYYRDSQNRFYPLIKKIEQMRTIDRKELEHELTQSLVHHQ